jgi:hypothetical protein
MTEGVLDSRARRTAKLAGLIAKNSCWRAGDCDNPGGYCLIDPCRNRIVFGERLDLSAEEVIEYCTSTEGAAA